VHEKGSYRAISLTFGENKAFSVLLEGKEKPTNSTKSRRTRDRLVDRKERRGPEPSLLFWGINAGRSNLRGKSDTKGRKVISFYLREGAARACFRSEKVWRTSSMAIRPSEYNHEPKEGEGGGNRNPSLHGRKK